MCLFLVCQVGHKGRSGPTRQWMARRNVQIEIVRKKWLYKCLDWRIAEQLDPDAGLGRVFQHFQVESSVKYSDWKHTLGVSH